MDSVSAGETLFCHQQKKNFLMHISKEFPVFSKRLMMILGVCSTVSNGLSCNGAC